MTMSEAVDAHRDDWNVSYLSIANDKSIAQDSVIDKDDKQPIAPDHFDEKYQTTKWEIWAYYAWVIN